MVRSRIFLILLFVLHSATAQEDDYVKSGIVDTGLVIIYGEDGNRYCGVYKGSKENYFVLEDLAVGEVNIRKDQVAKFIRIREGDELEITLVNGSIIKGIVSMQYSDKIVLNTSSSGKVEIAYQKIVQFRKKGETPSQKKEMTVKDLPGEDENKKALLAFGQRHFLTSNAFMPERGTAIGRTTMFTVYSFDYSVIEPLDLRISVLGFIPVLGLKSGFRITENLRFAVNTDVIILPIQGNTFVAGYAHSLITFGDIDNNITAGSLFVFTNEAFYPNPCLTFAGNLRLGKNVWLVSDNCLIPLQQFSYSPNPDYLGIYSLGIRYNGNWSSYDGGLFIIPQIFEELPVPIPLISYSVIF